MGKTRDIPQTLVYEMIDGTPVYYRGYQEVLAGSKKIEEIMGSSVLKGRVIAELRRRKGHLDLHRYQKGVDRRKGKGLDPGQLE